jgi:hypothetical protein
MAKASARIAGTVDAGVEEQPQAPPVGAALHVERHVINMLDYPMLRTISKRRPRRQRLPAVVAR